jgi:hypothetical protein
MHERDLENVEVCLGAEFERLLLGAPQRKVLCRRASACEIGRALAAEGKAHGDAWPSELDSRMWHIQ